MIKKIKFVETHKYLKIIFAGIKMRLIYSRLFEGWHILFYNNGLIKDKN